MKHNFETHGQVPLDFSISVNAEPVIENIMANRMTGTVETSLVVKSPYNIGYNVDFTYPYTTFVQDTSTIDASIEASFPNDPQKLLKRTIDTIHEATRGSFLNEQKEQNVRLENAIRRQGRAMAIASGVITSFGLGTVWSGLSNFDNHVGLSGVLGVMTGVGLIASSVLKDDIPRSTKELLNTPDYDTKVERTVLTSLLRKAASKDTVIDTNAAAQK